MDKLDKFHKTKKGYITFAVIEIILFYAIASVAIDTGNMFVYAAGIALVIGIANNIINVFKLHFKK